MHSNTLEDVQHDRRTVVSMVKPFSIRQAALTTFGCWTNDVTYYHLWLPSQSFGSGPAASSALNL